MGEGRARVVLVGARGRMGRLATELFAEQEDFELALALGREDDLERALACADVTLGLDLTVAGLGFEHGRTLLAAGVRPVIGTSGVTPEENAELDRLARERGLGGIVVPNFSLGMLVLAQAAELVARRFPALEIHDLHHERKRDAPSGTARDLAERLGRVVGKEPHELPIRSTRLPGLYAHHVLTFGAPGELVTLRHDMSGPDAFRPGILAALRYARTATGVARGLEAASEEY